MKRHWHIRSADGTDYRLGLWRDGEWHPAPVWRALRELVLLRERGARLIRKPYPAHWRSVDRGVSS